MHNAPLHRFEQRKGVLMGVAVFESSNSQESIDDEITREILEMRFMVWFEFARLDTDMPRVLACKVVQRVLQLADRNYVHEGVI